LFVPVDFWVDNPFMPVSAPPTPVSSAKALTIVAHAAFVPIGVVTVLLSPLLPTLTARWSLNYSQAGALFTAQFLSSTIAVWLSGILTARWGFRFAIKTGLIVIAIGVAGVLAGSRLFGLFCIVAYGAGIGLAVPAANLLVAEVNPGRRSAALNLLNFSWSAGAVACPFLVAAAIKMHRVPVFLGMIAGVSLLVAIGVAAMPSWIREPAISRTTVGNIMSGSWKHGAFVIVAALFFLYVGTENSFGGWVASYANSLGTMTRTIAVLTPSFFYSALMLGRWFAPIMLRRIDEIRVVQGCLLLASAGMAGLVGSHSLHGVIVSASAAGFGLSAVYPITISLLSREFGSEASRIGSLMFTLGNLGGACLPWLVGASSNRLGTLKAGLAVPLLGSLVMFFLYLRNWSPAAGEP
jgi:MFS transporter, FHS family, glucose/mannose:H+ symporter